MAHVGLQGRRCVHFDFGENLRQIADGKMWASRFNKKDLQILHESLTQGKLLENESFYLARKILGAFAVDRSLEKHDLVILNGLPRHLGQAQDTDQLIDIRAILSLECTSETVRARIQGNTGGDRTHRKDDALDKVHAKLKIFNKRTQPLLQHYGGRGIPIHGISVGINSTPEQMADAAVKLLDPNIWAK